MKGRNDQPDKYNSCKGQKGQIFQNFPMEILIFVVGDQRYKVLKE